jgi:ubiquinone/menaquinone biosynthesis C-methylase UbiE
VARALAEARPDIRVFGIDVASTMIAKAMASNGHVLNLNFCVGDGVSLSPYPDDTFDVVYSYIVFQHLPRHIVGQYLGDCARVIKPGGRLIFQVQEGLAPMPVDPAWDDFRTIRYYTKEQASALIRAPFKLTTVRGSGHNLFIEAVKG